MQLQQESTDDKPLFGNPYRLVRGKVDEADDLSLDKRRPTSPSGANGGGGAGAVGGGEQSRSARRASSRDAGDRALSPIAFALDATAAADSAGATVDRRQPNSSDKGLADGNDGDNSSSSSGGGNSEGPARITGALGVRRVDAQQNASAAGEEVAGSQRGIARPRPSRPKYHHHHHQQQQQQKQQQGTRAMANDQGDGEQATKRAKTSKVS